MGDRTSDERRGDTDDDMDLDTPLPPGQQGLEDVAWWWIAATADAADPTLDDQAAVADAADPTLDDQAAVAEDWLTAGLVALACVVVRAVTPGATYRALLTYLRATSLRDLTTEAAALVPEETAPFVHITLQDFTNQDVLAWIEETMNRRHARIDAL
jgi:hypothetical protein